MKHWLVMTFLNH